MSIKIYTDGSCAGNPGPGGWAAVIIGKNMKNELCGGEESTTNNRMELTAAIKALEYCDKKKLNLDMLEICTDSIYLKDGITNWINKWEKNNWKTSNKKNVKNIDLWKKLQTLTKSKKIKWSWVKAHSNEAMNNLADRLAKKATPI
jgi:ribonuclease HI